MRGSHELHDASNQATELTPPDLLIISFTIQSSACSYLCPRRRGSSCFR